MLKALTTMALLALPSTAIAANLAGDPPADTRTNLMDDPGSGWGFYVQGYDGAVTQNQIEVIDSFDFGGGDTLIETFIDQLSTGATFGAGVGVITPIDGLSLGIDVMHTHQDVAAFQDEVVVPRAQYDSLSVFGTVEGAYHLSPTFDIYATGGLGATSIHIHNPDSFIDQIDADTVWVPAYEVAVGLRAKVTDNVSLFTEVKHADVFTPAAFPATEGGELVESVAYGRNALVAGVRFGF